MAHSSDTINTGLALGPEISYEGARYSMVKCSFTNYVENSEENSSECPVRTNSPGSLRVPGCIVHLLFYLCY